MINHSPIITAAAMLALGTTASSAFAQGYGSGSASSAASSLGFTASPPIAQNSNVPIAAAPVESVEPPLTTGSITRRDRSWTRLHRR